MTPKEKAEELIETFYQKIIDTVDVNNAFYYSTRCAIIAVDEIDKAITKTLGQTISHNQITEIEYWESVKQELENL